MSSRMFKRAFAIQKRQIIVAPGKMHFFLGNANLSGSDKGYTVDTASDSFSDIGFPTSINGIAMGGVFQFSVSPNGKWLVVALNGSGRVLLYRRDGDVWTSVSIGSMPTLVANPASFFPVSWFADSSAFVVTCGTILSLYTFQLSPDNTTFNYVSVSGSGASGTSMGVTVSPDGVYAAWVTTINTTTLTMYKWNGGGYSLLSTLSLGVSQSTGIYGISWSLDGQFLFVGTNNLNASLIVYRRDGDTFTRILQVPTASNARHMAMSPDGLTFCLGVGLSPFLLIYKWDPVALTMTKVTGTPVLPAAGKFSSFSPDGSYFSISWDGATNTSKLAVYRRVGDTFIDTGFSIPPDVRTNGWTNAWGAVPTS